MSARDGALFHERLLGREQRRVELALGRGEGAVHGESTCCGGVVSVDWIKKTKTGIVFAHRCQRHNRCER
jgi:hypothetical protein